MQTDKERISAIEASLPHLATKADVYKISAQLILITAGVVSVAIAILKFVVEGN